MVELRNCPIETTLKYIGKKWTFQIVRDLSFGKSKFSEFLSENPKMTPKMLSERLKELEKDLILEKIIVSKTPLKAEYFLTKRGDALNKLLFEMALFSAFEYPEDVIKSENFNTEEVILNFGQMFRLTENEILNRLKYQVIEEDVEKIKF